MPDAIACLRCKTPMDPGIIPDTTYGGQLQENWRPGQPQKSFWTGLKIDHRGELPVTTWRCPSCGMLESYAKPA